MNLIEVLIILAPLVGAIFLARGNASRAADPSPMYYGLPPKPVKPYDTAPDCKDCSARTNPDLPVFHCVACHSTPDRKGFRHHEPKG